MGDMGDASGQYLHGQSFTYEPLHTVTDGGGGGEKYEKFTLSTKKTTCFITKHMYPSAQWAQTNRNLGVCSRERFTAGPCKERDGSCSPKLCSLKHFNKALLMARWRRRVVSCCKLLGVGILCSYSCPCRSRPWCFCKFSTRKILFSVLQLFISMWLDS